jgi:cell volume regulation protein A
MEVSYLFAGIGMIILIGFMGSLFFERTKIPDILILIFIGVLLGPLLTQYTDFGLLDDPEMATAMTSIAPHFAALALVIILFDGGLNLHLEKTMKKMGISILHTSMAFIGSVTVTALAGVYLLGMDLIAALLLGCILGGTSGAIVISLIMKSCATENTKIMLTLESVLTDVLCIVTAIVFIEVLRGVELDTGALIQKLLGSFIIAGFIAFLFGVVWLMVLKKLAGKQFAFMITIAALLLLYAVAEFIHVSGAIAALVFGLVLSNKDEIARILKMKGDFVFDTHIKQFHTEVSFLIRTFFFVYLGITFTFTIDSSTFGSLPAFIPPWLIEQPIMMFMVFLAVLFTGIFIVRYLSTTITCMVSKELKVDKPYIYTMIPRGLAAAVLAQLPFAIKQYTTVPEPTPYYILMQPYQSIFLNVVFMIIVLSVIATSIGIFFIERSRIKSSACSGVSASGGDWAVKSPTYKRTLEQENKAKWGSKSPPKTWSDPSAQKQPAHQPVPPPKKQYPATERQAPRPTAHATPPPKKPAQVHPAPKPAPHQKTRTVTRPPHQQPREHPLVKRAAESEKAPPKKQPETKAKKK